MTRRLVALLACLAVGALIGALVQAALGRAEGWLAIPLLVVAGWLFVADPTRCDPPREPPHEGQHERPPKNHG